jgi:uncharacterized integral membrane protein
MAEEEHQYDHPIAHDAARTVKLALAVVLVIGIVALALDNRDKTRVGWVFGDGTEPLWVVLVGAAVAGAMIGALVTHRTRHRH